MGRPEFIAVLGSAAGLTRDIAFVEVAYRNPQRMQTALELFFLATINFGILLDH